MRVVYDCTVTPQSLEDYVDLSAQGRQFVGQSPPSPEKDFSKTHYYDKLSPYYKLKNPQDSTLIFESRFESGNLQRVIQVGDYEYDLELKFDHNTTSMYSQWFFFKITNTRKRHSYKFNIINLVKSDSLYSCGMKPLMYSKKEAEFTNTGWYRFGADLIYFPSKKRGGERGNQDLFSLSFTSTFKYDNDSVYIANCYPYTFSDCQHFINKVQKSTPRNIFKRSILTKSLAGNELDLLIITNFDSSEEEISLRRAVVLTARVHPGETNSSFIIQGIIDFLTGPEKTAKILRNTYVFKIVPMLNPDGVIVGNYRCSLSGLDLNR